MSRRIETGTPIHRADRFPLRGRMRTHRRGRLGERLVETRFVLAVRETREGQDAEVEDGPELRRDVDVHGTTDYRLPAAVYGP